MQRLGIFGGTFDPPHRGHLLIALQAQIEAELDQVLWIPAHTPHHRAKQLCSDYGDRVQMVERSLADVANNPTRLMETERSSEPPQQLPSDGFSRFQLSTIEAQLPQPCYAIDTFNALRAKNSDCQWFWILGLDAFQRLPRWYGRHELIPQCVWLVIPRRLDANNSAPVASASEAVAQVNAAPDLQQNLQQSWQQIGEQVAAQLSSQQISLRWQFLDLPPLPVSSSLIRDRRQRGESIDHLVSPAVWQYIEQRSLYRSQN